MLEEENDCFGEVFYLSNTEEYKIILDAFKNNVIDEFGTITDSNFIKNEMIELDKNISNFINQQDKLSKYTEDVRHYMWVTRKAGRDFNFYAAIDSLNSSQFTEMINNYTSEFHEFLNLLFQFTHIICIAQSILFDIHDAHKWELVSNLFIKSLK